jgi:hypothetical protein
MKAMLDARMVEKSTQKLRSDVDDPMIALCVLEIPVAV